MSRYREPAAFALATVMVQVGVTALLDLAFSFAGVYPSFVKWVAIGLLGSAAGWRGSTLGLLAIVLADLAWYGVTVYLQAGTDIAGLIRLNVLFFALAAVGYLLGVWLRRSRTTRGALPGVPGGH